MLARGRSRTPSCTPCSRRGPGLRPHVRPAMARSPPTPLTIVSPGPTGGELGCHLETAGIRPRAAASDGVCRGAPGLTTGIRARRQTGSGCPPVQGRLAHHLNHLYRQDPGPLVGISATGDDQDAYDPEASTMGVSLTEASKSFHRAAIKSPIHAPCPRTPVTTGDLLKPSWGLEPQTPSLPSRSLGCDCPLLLGIWPYLLSSGHFRDTVRVIVRRSADRSRGPCRQILRASRKSISRWRGTAVDRSASNPQKLWLPPSRRSRAPCSRRCRSRSRRFTRR